MILISSVFSKRLNEMGAHHLGRLEIRFLYIVRMFTAWDWLRATIQECQFSNQ